MNFVLFDTQTVVAFVTIFGLAALVGVALLTGVTVDAVLRHRSTRVARAQSLRGYYGSLFHLHRPHAAH